MGGGSKKNISDESIANINLEDIHISQDGKKQDYVWYIMKQLDEFQKKSTIKIVYINGNFHFFESLDFSKYSFIIEFTWNVSFDCESDTRIAWMHFSGSCSMSDNAKNIHIKLRDIAILSDTRLSIQLQSTLLSIHWVVNTWKIILSGMCMRLSLKNSDLWYMIYDWVDIKKFKIENANLNECMFNGVTFPKNYVLLREGINNKKMKDNYRQLKYIMDKNGNLTEANMFYAKEMHYLFLSLSWFRTPLKKFLLLFLGAVSYFGNNWALPILYLFIAGIFFTWLDGKLFYIQYDLTSSLNFEYINTLFWNINPFNRIFVMDGTNITGWNFRLFWQKLILITLYWNLWVALKRSTKR